MNKTSKFKKALSVVLVLMVTLSCLTLVPMTTGAADATLGTAENPYKIGTTAELQALSSLLSGTSKFYAELTADVVFDEGTEWTSISYSGALHFNGNGYKIANLAITGRGIFTSVGRGSVIENLHFSNVDVTASAQGTGILLGHTNAGLTLDNVSTDNLCSVTSDQQHCGGLIGRFYDIAATLADSTCNIVISNCVNNATVTSTNERAGGILGSYQNTDSKLEIYNCVNTGAITATNYVGGVVGGSQAGDSVSEVSVYDCYNIGSLAVTAAAKNNWAGGVIGDWRMYGVKDTTTLSSLTVARCYDYSTRNITSGTTGTYSGGVICNYDGYQGTKDIVDCYAVNAWGTETAYTYAIPSSDEKVLSKTNYGLITHTLEAQTPANTYITLSTGETTLGAEMKRIDDAITASRVTLDIGADSKNLGVRVKLTDPHGFMVITNVKLNGSVLASSEYETALDDLGFIFYTEDPATTATEGAKVSGTAYGATRFSAAYTDLPTSELNTTIYFVAYAVIDGVTVTSDAREINLYDEVYDAAVDGYFGDTATGVAVPTEEKALYRAMIEYYCAYATPNDMPVWES